PTVSSNIPSLLGRSQWRSRAQPLYEDEIRFAQVGPVFHHPPAQLAPITLIEDPLPLQPSTWRPRVDVDICRIGLLSVSPCCTSAAGSAHPAHSAASPVERKPSG